MGILLFVFMLVWVVVLVNVIMVMVGDDGVVLILVDKVVCFIIEWCVDCYNFENVEMGVRFDVFDELYYDEWMILFN